MNKEEAIEKINNISTLKINDTVLHRQFDMVDKNKVLDIISKINEPKKAICERGGRMNKQELIEKLEGLKQLFESCDKGSYEKGFINALIYTLNVAKQLDEPEKPVVPKFVADWVDNSREYLFDFDEWFDWNNQPKTVQLWLNSENKRQAELNALALSMLVVHGRDAVIVEEEKLYTVEIPNPNSKGNNKIYLCKDDTTGKVYLCKGNFNPSKNRNLRLTESEIKQDFEWAWQFAKEVEE
jgi:hypothetical protein|nr:MAG TPA: Protein of unknown function (DUF1642) [Caudoviricetes sp.]